MGGNGTFVCTSNSSIVWIVREPGSTHLYYLNSAVPSFVTFSPRGSGWTSTLTIPGIQSKNLTIVVCGANELEGISQPNSSGAVLRIYGKLGSSYQGSLSGQPYMHMRGIYGLAGARLLSAVHNNFFAVTLSNVSIAMP